MKSQALLDLAVALAQADDPFAPFAQFLAARGGRGFFYGFAALSSDLHQIGYTDGLHFHHSYSAEWEEAVGPQALIDNDHSIEAMDRGARMVEWMPMDYAPFLATLSPKQRKQFEIEADLGMICGASLLLDGHRLGFSGMGLWTETQRTHEMFRLHWDRFGAELTAASNLLDVAVREARPNLLVRLTPREIDCLAWLAHGLRPSEICYRLGISEKTFEKHIATAKAKLKSRTRDQALAKAVLLNLLPL
ncbi:DNA-binding CsgD family transcriptional regulator [Rhodobacter aestuarii]|uniref:DNA-binding transcriptional regulator, CsgD family n=1 Tax=Rhodobacter aestuarii TaxID=453582 RepID=A0A1N7PZ71_9RHOB|nr:helix-turn-helix transcriptional regulator [Rhodobacter aestuarii]PTV93965.1 DNA-binding CsgD family transcriptional regulator [Rhodobacter aestuarii]SIT15876.1 DNA-binding transcriptional regulator, CsgD family [Rhodobacter aestuarii]